MKISTRLFTGFGLLILLFILCTSIALNALNRASDGMDDTVNIKMKKYQLVLDMRSSLRDMAIAVRNVVLLTDPQAMKSEWDRLQKQKTLYITNRQALGNILETDSTPAGRETFKRMTDAEPATFTSLDRVGQLGLNNQTQQATAYLMNVTRPTQNVLLNALNDMAQVQMKNSQSAVEQNSAAADHSSLIIIILAGVSVLIAAGTCILTVRTLMQQLGGEPAQAQALAATIASGDLTTQVALRRNDTASMLASLDSMQTNLRQLVSQIKDASASVALAADEISQGNTELSSRTEQQAAALQETAASMEQLTATVKSNAAGAQQTAEAARGAATLARSGEADVQQMSETMSDISMSATKVRDITTVIESIAFQTNILALNAAVEAARAGEDGRGFAVVAGEVRTLAQRSATAARDIKQLIEQAVAQIESGVEVAAGTGQSILKIVGMVGDLAGSMDEISLASSEQMRGISQVSIAVSQMDGVTQNNAALVEESSSASQSLAEQAHALRGMVETFRV
ncbi:methyl-accepting chemotaxis protein [Erwinia psidii]|uniref:Chemotaxis protein n=1 Tax=Erwinia psidii TaxID=69224 RepID=A0A3N6TP78_9GAMM|nr:methyl-accepting chemotaxis protein [Erwinia psidii]MCX8958052.1 chemotaxis protein [Erwinia psidii]MCX8962453.1 chemotaxis protein [Erwinia psidii]RQM37032.1 chemotaxis protein [Erwinia psidii]